MKALRKERGWSQEALAGEAGLDRTHVSGIERMVKNHGHGRRTDCQGA